MSTRDQWHNRCTFTRRDFIGMDTPTRQPRYGQVVVLNNELCDMFEKKERRAQQGPQGTVYNTVQQPFLKIFPKNYQDLPDPNDYIKVDGATYRVLDREDWSDAGSGRYMGSRMRIQRTSPDESPSLGPVEAEGAGSASGVGLTAI